MFIFSLWDMERESLHVNGPLRGIFSQINESDDVNTFWLRLKIMRVLKIA